MSKKQEGVAEDRVKVMAEVAHDAASRIIDAIYDKPQLDPNEVLVVLSLVIQDVCHYRAGCLVDDPDYKANRRYIQFFASGLAWLVEDLRNVAMAHLDGRVEQAKAVAAVNVQLEQIVRNQPRRRRATARKKAP